MAFTPLPLIAPQQLTNSAVAYYTSTNIVTRIDKMSFTNTDTAAHTVTVFLVPSGGSAVASTTITSAHAIAAGETWNSPDAVGQFLAPGGKIYAEADSGTVVTISAAGTQIG